MTWSLATSKKRPVIASPHSVFGEMIAVVFFLEVVFGGR
jgi:hypothetical protein